MAYIQLPIIPLNLILSQLSNYSPFLHMILACVSLTPSLDILQTMPFNFRLPGTLRLPPPQFTSLLLIPLTASFYRVVFHRFSQHILGTLDPTEYQDGMRFFVNAESEPEGGAPAAPVEPAPAAPNNRIAWVTLGIKSLNRLGRHIAMNVMISHVPMLRRLWMPKPTSVGLDARSACAPFSMADV